MDEMIRITRELGAAIQKDPRYLALEKAQAANDRDEALGNQMRQIQMVHTAYQNEAAKPDADAGKLDEYDREFNVLYQQLMANENMQNYETARKAVDEMMRYVTEILGLCVRGADPATCEPDPVQDSCGGDCGGCSGCS